nr:MAG TPA: hypothetical protein [Caudoviricetes sp.]
MFSVIERISSTINEIMTICLITFITSNLSSWNAMTTITRVKNFLTIPLNITELDSLPLHVLLLFCHIAEIKKPTIKSIIIKTINIIKSSVGLPIKLINRLPIVPVIIETMFFSLILITPFYFLGLPVWFTAHVLLLRYPFHSSDTRLPSLHDAGCSSVSAIL